MYYDIDSDIVFVFNIVFCEVFNVMLFYENVCVFEVWIIFVKERKFYVCYIYMYILKIIFIKNFKMML